MTTTTRTAAASSLTLRSTFNAPRRAARGASLALAAVMTLAVMGGLNTLADSEHASAQPVMAQTAAAARS